MQDKKHALDDFAKNCLKELKNSFSTGNSSKIMKDSFSTLEKDLNEISIYAELERKTLGYTKDSEFTLSLIILQKHNPGVCIFVDLDPNLDMKLKSTIIRTILSLLIRKNILCTLYFGVILEDIIKIVDPIYWNSLLLALSHLIRQSPMSAINEDVLVMHYKNYIYNIRLWESNSNAPKFAVHKTSIISLLEQLASYMNALILRLLNTMIYGQVIENIDILLSYMNLTVSSEIAKWNTFKNLYIFYLDVSIGKTIYLKMVTQGSIRVNTDDEIVREYLLIQELCQ